MLRFWAWFVALLPMLVAVAVVVTAWTVLEQIKLWLYRRRGRERGATREGTDMQVRMAPEPPEERQPVVLGIPQIAEVADPLPVQVLRCVVCGELVVSASAQLCPVDGARLRLEKDVRLLFELDLITHALSEMVAFSDHERRLLYEVEVRAKRDMLALREAIAAGYLGGGAA